MNEYEILEAVRAGHEGFGCRCQKFSGALTVQIIRRALEKHGVRASPRDVFMRGLPFEIDVLVAKRGTEP